MQAIINPSYLKDGSTEPFYIFLDFDGVLHRNGEKTFQKAQFLAKFLKKHPNVRIVFSTSWREYATLDKLKSYLPESLHDKCIGMTPVIRDGARNVRYREIMMFNEKNDIADNWAALDDMKILFPAQCPHLIAIDPLKGFCQEYAVMLEQKIIHHTAKKLPKRSLCR